VHVRLWPISDSRESTVLHPPVESATQSGQTKHAQAGPVAARFGLLLALATRETESGEADAEHALSELG
jgi:hypothetical protein